MICIQHELSQMSLATTDQHDLQFVVDAVLPSPPPVQTAPHSNVESNSPATATNPCQNRWMPTAGGAFGGYSGATAGTKTTGFMDNILGCMRPLLFSFAYKSSSVIETQRGATSHTNQWEIPFDEIFDLEWVGSGAQGTVFSGRLKNEIVAVKKVRDMKETDIKHLRKLDHENIIKFK